ncbi:MAG: hypothetical protein GOU97_00780 [Nanoarchaeota archaeon]|nr:hypothetical protein [Nanoarchaeota archaeon]
MESLEIIKILKKAREQGSKRKFVQSIDLIITLKNVDLKKNDKKIEIFEHLPAGRGRKKARIAAFVDKDTTVQAKKHCDEVIEKKDFSKWDKPREIRKLVRTNDFFIAQASVMIDQAKIFGKYLGAKGKMPNPKAGQVIFPKTDLEALTKKLRDTVILRVKKHPMIQVLVGTEDMKDEQLSKNVKTVLEEVKRHYAQNEIRDAFLKLTMGKPVKLW